MALGQGNLDLLPWAAGDHQRDDTLAGILQRSGNARNGGHVADMQTQTFAGVHRLGLQVLAPDGAQIPPLALAEGPSGIAAVECDQVGGERLYVIEMRIVCPATIWRNESRI
ncbi:hypothetical protein GCM10008942_21230 [Rhizomicrobium electricum]|uniref:Uncharacterized protein n=1 Tax=Rhizomicrobium electricum TaxID=480070 RepID=A0ABP3PTY4_9PROT